VFLQGVLFCELGVTFVAEVDVAFCTKKATKSMSAQHTSGFGYSSRVNRVTLAESTHHSWRRNTQSAVLWCRLGCMSPEKGDPCPCTGGFHSHMRSIYDS